VKVAPDTVRKEAKGEVAKAPTFAAFIVAVGATAPTTAKLEALPELKPEQIRLVDVKEFVTAANETEFNAALEQNETALESLRAALLKNELITKALSGHSAKPAVTDIVATEIGADGEVVVYFQRKM